MNGLLCLKWNNHSSAFLKLLTNLRSKELYCDSTIACHGRFYPVHRLVLSTCSRYFEEIFEQAQCKHPFIIMKDIKPKELEALLSYMYKGEVNVLQEMLPDLIKAAEALQIKGLAVPDETTDLKENIIPTGRRKMSKRAKGMQSNENESLEVQNEFSDKTNKEMRTKDLNLTKPDKLISSEHLFNRENKSLKSSVRANKDDKNTLNQVCNIKLEPDELLDLPEESLSIDDLQNFIPFMEPKLEGDSSLELPLPTENEFPNLEVTANKALEDCQYNVDQAAWDTNDISNFEQNEPSEQVCGMGISPDLESRNQEFLETSSENLNTSEDPSSTSKRLVSNISNKISSNFKCPYCHYHTSRKADLRSHIMCRHTGERPYACRFCPYRCTTKTPLKIHMRKHTGEKPFSCPHCHYRSARNDTLKSHINLVHLFKR